MFTVNTKTAEVTYDAKAKVVPLGSVPNTYYVDVKEDVRKLTTPELIEVYNTLAKNADLGVREVSRFATRPVGEERTWGLFVRLKAMNGEKEEPTPEPKKTSAKKEKKPKGQPRTKGQLKDKELPRAAKVYPLREKSLQEKALGLISRTKSEDNPLGGIAVDDFVKEMNEGPGKPKWNRGNAWGSIRYILHDGHGYGIRCRGDRFYVVK